MKDNKDDGTIMKLLLEEGDTVDLRNIDILDAHGIMHERVMEHKVYDMECRELFIDNMLENNVFITVEEKVQGGTCAMHTFLSIDA